MSTLREVGLVTKQRADVRRIVESRELSGYVATFNPDGVTLKPKRARKQDAEIYATWDQVYRWALIARVPPITKKKKRRKA